MKKADDPFVVLGVWMEFTGRLFREACIRNFGESELRPAVIREAAAIAAVKGDRYASDDLVLAARWREGESDAVKAELHRQAQETADILCGPVKREGSR